MKKENICNMDCFNCIYNDCILPDTYVSADEVISSEKRDEFVEKIFSLPKKNILREQRKEYYEKNKEKRKKYACDYYWAHRDEINAKRKKQRNKTKKK